MLFADLDDANREIQGSRQDRNGRTTGRILVDLDGLVAGIRTEDIALPNPRLNAVCLLYTSIFSNHGNITLYDLGLTGVARTITKGVSNPVFILSLIHI